jgi:hypothetical protein
MPWSSRPAWTTRWWRPAPPAPPAPPPKVPPGPLPSTPPRLVALVTMFDSTSAADIPPDAKMVAGYGDGAYKWTPADWARFPRARGVVIATSAGYFTAIVLDVETGDARPQQAPGWADGSRLTTGWVPTLYGTKATLDQCRPLVAAAGIDCDYWLADWTTVPHLPAGYGACQFAAPGHGSPGHFDMSVVASWWPRTVGTPRPL